MGWRTNRTTGKAFQPDDRDLVSKRRRRKVSARFRRDWRAWCDRQADARQKLVVGRKGWRLLRNHGFNLWLYTVSVSELGGAEWLEDCDRYDDPALVEGWIRLLDKAFGGTPYLFALHVGRCDRVHAHVLTGQLHNVPALSNNPERRKRVDNTPADFRRVVAYLTANQYATPKQLAAYDRAVKRAGGERYLPKHSGFRGFQSEKRVQKDPEKRVGDGAAEIYPVGIVAYDKAPVISPERFETWLSGAFGAFSVAVTTLDTSPPARKQLMT